MKKTKLKLFWSGGKVPHRFLFGSLEEVESFCEYLLNTNEKIKFLTDEMHDLQSSGGGKLAMIEQYKVKLSEQIPQEIKPVFNLPKNISKNLVKVIDRNRSISSEVFIFIFQYHDRPLI